jgi:cold shock protein
MPVGRIKKVVTNRGYGFILQEGGGKDVFFHYSELEGINLDTLEEGDQVDYKAERGDKGPRATVVRKIHKVV